MVLGLEGGLLSAKPFPTALHTVMKQGFLNLPPHSAGRNTVQGKGPGAEVLPSGQR